MMRFSERHRPLRKVRELYVTMTSFSERHRPLRKVRELYVTMTSFSGKPQWPPQNRPYVATSKPATVQTFGTKGFYSFSLHKSNKGFDPRLECDRPERRIGQRWEATRAPTQAPRPKRGVERCPVLYLSFGIGTKR